MTTSQPDPEAFEADEGPAAPPFDPTGLDLARSIADAVAHTAPLPAPASPKPSRPRRRRPGSTRARNLDPTPLGDALGRVINDQGWSTDLSVHALLARWHTLVGQTVAEHSFPESYRAKVVHVRTDSTAWASQLRLMAPQIVAKLNESLGDGTVLRIQVKGPDAPSWKHGMRSVRDGRGPRDTYG